MATYFALHGTTKGNSRKTNYAKELGYDESSLPEDQLPFEEEMVTGGAPYHLVVKGKLEAEFLADQLIKELKSNNTKLDVIYTGQAIRMVETSVIIAEKLAEEFGEQPNVVICGDFHKNWGKFTQEKIPVKRLTEFYKYPEPLLEKIKTLKYLFAYLFAPQKLGIEKSKEHRSRIGEFLLDKLDVLQDPTKTSLVIGGTDTFKALKKLGVELKYETRDPNGDLERGILSKMDVSHADLSEYQKENE